MTTFEILSLVLIVISPAIGSFLAVLIDRLPRGEDVIKAPSRCRGCDARLGVADLIPLVSFALRRGRCGRCGSVIPPWVLYVELLAIGAAVLAVIAAQGNGALALLNAAFLWLLIALAVSDALWMRLPDLLSGALALVAFGLASLPTGIGLQAVWGAMIGAGSFAILRVIYTKLRDREGLGLGDVKLMVGLGALTGPLLLPWLVLLAALTALGTAMVQHLRGTGQIAAQTPLPFGTALCAAGFAIWAAQVWTATL